MNTELKKNPKGIEKLGVPALEPFKLNPLHLKSGDGGLALDVKMKDVTVHDSTNLKCDKAKGFEKTFDNKIGTLRCSFPSLRITGTIKLLGKVLLMEFNGESKTSIELDKVVCNAKWRMKSVKKSGQEFMSIEDVDLRIDASK